MFFYFIISCPDLQKSLNSAIADTDILTFGTQCQERERLLNLASFFELCFGAAELAMLAAKIVTFDFFYYFLFAKVGLSPFLQT